MRFNGEKFAQEIKDSLKPKVDALVKEGKQPFIVSLVFDEDEVGKLYTRLKQEAASELGIKYQPEFFSFQTKTKILQNKIDKLNQDESVTGIMIQKPTRKLWEECSVVTPGVNFNQWWRELVSQIKPEKDVDGLSPITLEAVKNGTWEEKGLVPPATAQAVFKIVTYFVPDWSEKRIAIIGKSDLVGRPLYSMLKHTFLAETLVTSISCRLEPEIFLFGRKELGQLLSSGKGLKEFDIIISSTGQPGLIDTSMIKEGVALIDVGEPKGDINPYVYKKASFYTPVPGGVGPVTVACLMENGVELVKKFKIKN